MICANVQTTKTIAYDPDTNKWSQKKSIPLNIQGVSHMANAAEGSNIYLMGGLKQDHGNNWPSAHSISNVFKYNVYYDSWEDLSSLPQTRGGGAAGIINGHLHFVGGATFVKGKMFTKDHTDHWALDLSNPHGGWKGKASMPGPGRNHLGAIGHGGKLYVFGGQKLEDEWTTNHDMANVYDPAQNSWKTLSSMPYKLGHISPSVVSYGGGIFIVGGAANGSPHNPSALLPRDVANNNGPLGKTSCACFFWVFFGMFKS